MSENKIWYLKQVDLFKGIPESEIMAIAKNVEERNCQIKEVLYTPFDVSNGIYVRKKGEVTLYHSHRGKQIIIDVLREGSIFGALSMTEEPSTHFAEVSQPAYVCKFSIDEFLGILRTKPDVMLKLLQQFATKVNSYEENIKSNLYDAKEKILSHLQRQQKQQDSGILKMLGYKSKSTHEKIAHFTGLTRETVTRAIQELRKDGRVDYAADGSLVYKM